MSKQIARLSVVFAATCTLLAVATTAHAQNSPRSQVQWTKDTLEVVKANVEKDEAVLIDVRSEQEWNKGHIEGAIFLPVTSLRAKGGNRKELEKKLPQKKILYTYCAIGMRSKTAAFPLAQHGYEVRALKAGYDDLLKAGFKKAKPEPAAETNK